VFKALGDNTRYAIYLELARSTGPLSTGDIAEVLDLHPNTVRPHLERMREVGLLEVDHDNRGTVGRPQHRYRLAADAPSLGLEPPAYPLLAGLLASVASTLALSPDEVAAVGRERGRRAAAERLARLLGDQGDQGDLGDPDQDDSAAGGLHAATPIDDAGLVALCVGEVVAELSDMGYDPAVAEGGDVTTVAFTRCPFQELAEAHPELVCHLHRGIVEGMVEYLGGVAVERFGTLVDRDPCRVELAAR